MNPPAPDPHDLRPGRGSPSAEDRASDNRAIRIKSNFQRQIALIDQPQEGVQTPRGNDEMTAADQIRDSQGSEPTQEVIGVIFSTGVHDIALS